MPLVDPSRDAAERTARRLRRFHPESAFGGFTNLDGTLRFYLRVNQLLPQSGNVVNVGCGRGSHSDDPVRVRRELRILRGADRHVIGIDVDPVAENNQDIDEFRLIRDDGAWPLDDGSADMALADWVLEHVENPRGFFDEAARVLRPGGCLCVRTINANGYVGLASRLTPNSLHYQLLRHITPGREEQDVFPTTYRCNTLRKLRGTLDNSGFDAAVYGFEGDPGYLKFNSATYALALTYRRLAPGFLRFGLCAFARRR